nr:ABC transporter ATP-binding protein [Metabacillus iocasae]
MVLEDISFHVKPGEIVSLLGASGSGKTTLLKMILGLMPVDGGTIHYQDKDVTHLPMKKRGFNIVFQDYALFPHLNAVDNITYGLRNNPDLTTEAEVEEYIDFLGLTPHKHKKIHELSGGQKQRVALARTLVMKPNVLLLDEPLSALDGVIKESIKERIQSIAKEFGLATIIVTHDPEEALTLSDKILLINKGRVAQFDTPERIIQSPASTFVDEFIVRQLNIKRRNLFTLFGGSYA